RDDAPTPTLRSSAAILQVRDVDASMRWYAANFGFVTHPFPPAPPHVFCVMSRDGVELMLQKRDDVPRTRAADTWHVYLRVEGVRDLYDAARANAAVDVVEALAKKPYGDSEFAVRDPDGYVLVFGELI